MIKKEDVLDILVEECTDAYIYQRLFEKIDALPETVGYWVDKGSLSARCSACGCKSTGDTPYCPMCGKEMRV